MPGLPRRRTKRRVLVWLAALATVGAGIANARQRPLEVPPTPLAAAPPNGAFTVDATVGLASLISLGDGHLQRMADGLGVLAGTAAARSADWSRIHAPLADVARRNVAALVWFALPDGSYWSVDSGRTGGNLARRAYFPKVLAGQTVIGDLVVSTSTKKSVAIVAVPVRRADGKVVGVLGSSIYLDSLSLRLAREMELPKELTFYSINDQPIGALNRNVDLIFSEPLTLGADLRRAIREMMTREQGVVAYDFLGSHRTVVYRRSPVTGWWYALAQVKPLEAAGR